MNDNLEVEVFRAGDYGEKGRWDEGHLDQIAADYNPALHEAPVTLDHARSGPALGWVEAVRRVGDRLVARLRGVSTRLLELLREGAIKKRSVEIYPALRETGRPYLRAVSFLGAAVPEVKGLADPPLAEAAAPLFADDAQAPALAFEEALEVGRRPPVGGTPARERPNPTDPAPATDSEENALTTSETKLATEAPLAAPGRSGLLFSEVAARLRDSGKWRPAWAGRGIAEFYQALTKLDAIEFAEDDATRRVTPSEWFAAFLESLPPIVTLGEAAPAPDLDLDGLLSGSVAVDPASLALHRAAVALRRTSPGVSYAEALARCSPRQ